MGATARAGTGGSVLLWHQSFTSRQGQASADDRCQAELSGQLDGGALLPKNTSRSWIEPPRGMDAQ
jgi:hypothetical protein